MGLICGLHDSIIYILSKFIIHSERLSLIYPKMADHNLYPPYFHVNQGFKKNVSNTEFDDESKELYIKEIVKDADSMETFLSHHKIPCYQGPLMNPIGLNTLRKSFSSFTTFKHIDNVSCGTWTAENPSGGGLRKHTKVVDKDID